MKLTLPHFGLDEVEIDPKTLIEFPNGLPGFEDCMHFKLFHSADSPVIFHLQSIDDSSVAFSLVDPESLRVFYKMSLTDEEQNILQAEANDELQIAVILAWKEESNIAVHGTIVANYTSPIVINVSKRIALQKTLQDSEFAIYSYQPLAEVAQTSSASISCFHTVPQIRSVALDRACSLA